MNAYISDLADSESHMHDFETCLEYTTNLLLKICPCPGMCGLNLPFH